MRAGAARRRDLSMNGRSRPVRVIGWINALRQRTADAETTPSRSPGAGVVGGMREDAGLALIRPVEAGALVAGARPRLEF